MDKSLKKRIRDMPIKRAMFLFIVTALLLAALNSVVTVLSTSSLRMELSRLGDYNKVGAINSVLNLLIFVYVIGFIIAAVYIFYNIKLRKPIQQLMNGTEQIVLNNLDFTMDYISNDELGLVCTSFEIMKTELRQSNTKMWRASEERKKLNAVFAHDLRTPLTVLKGYTDFLEEYIPSKQMEPCKVLETTKMMSQHIERIEAYVNMMSAIGRVEDTPIVPKAISGKALGSLLQNTLNNLGKQTEVNLSSTIDLHETKISVDIDAVQRVMDNLLSNAARYTKGKIDVAVCTQDEFFVLSVADDGNGFTPEYLERAFTPFYQKDKAEHFGLGLSICKTLCQNHGGEIKISNMVDGGAKVVATFKIR